MILERTDPPTSRSAFPIVGGVELDLLREGEWVTVDGDSGVVDLEAVNGVSVVTSLLEREDGKVLLLRRSERVGSFPGRWAGVSGFLEAPTAEAQARLEIEQETGLKARELELRATADPVYVRDGPRGYIVHPFRFAVRQPEIRLDREHTESRWVDPREIDSYPTVPKLAQVWAALLLRAVERKR
ncbi:MAG: NUDIX domain-containing protein [Thermoplasmata archaeon]|nr:NUDIX domain-containing protein [Thermoplasmata archaeon]